MGGFGDWGLKGGTGRALGAWVSFWVWWGFKQASIYLGLGVALIDGRVLAKGPALLPLLQASNSLRALLRRILPWLAFRGRIEETLTGPASQ